MKNIFQFILITISLIFSSCKKDGEIKLPNTFCLKLSENGQFYEYDELNRIKEIYYFDSENKRYTGTSYTYSGDTIIKKSNVPDLDWTAKIIEKSIIGNNGFIQKTFYKMIKYNQSTIEYSDSNVYSSDKYLTKTIRDSGFKIYYFYEINGNLKEEWIVNGVDSFLSNKYEYDLLNENKEATWKEWVERKGKGNKNMLLNQIQGDYMYAYSYSFKNGYPIAKQVTFTSPNFNTMDFYNITWSCLQ